jgi:hypothetical protein
MQGAVPCQQHWHQVRAIRSRGTDVAGVHTSRLSELMHPAHAFIMYHKPLDTDKYAVLEPCKRWRRCPVGL